MIYLDWQGHLFSDTSLEELYEFAVNKLKLNPKWNHYSRSFPHFDLTTKNKKDIALKLGAVYLDNARDVVAKIHEMRITFKNEFPKYECQGLNNQKIFRVDFEKYFNSKADLEKV